MRVAQTSYTLMACIEHEVFKLMAFIHKKVINAHLPEIDNIIRALFDLEGNALEFYFQVGLAL